MTEAARPHALRPPRADRPTHPRRHHTAGNARARAHTAAAAQHPPRRSEQDIFAVGLRAIFARAATESAGSDRCLRALCCCWLVAVRVARARRGVGRLAGADARSCFFCSLSRANLSDRAPRAPRARAPRARASAGASGRRQIPPGAGGGRRRRRAGPKAQGRGAALAVARCVSDSR